ncbi:hypothetical protein FKM82_009172 [Ascaphus truei]
MDQKKPDENKMVTLHRNQGAKRVHQLLQLARNVMQQICTVSSSNVICKSFSHWSILQLIVKVIQEKQLPGGYNGCSNSLLNLVVFLYCWSTGECVNPMSATSPRKRDQRAQDIATTP